MAPMRVRVIVAVVSVKEPGHKLLAPEYPMAGLSEETALLVITCSLNISPGVVYGN